MQNRILIKNINDDCGYFFVKNPQSNNTDPVKVDVNWKVNKAAVFFRVVTNVQDWLKQDDCKALKEFIGKKLGLNPDHVQTNIANVLPYVLTVTIEHSHLPGNYIGPEPKSTLSKVCGFFSCSCEEESKENYKQVPDGWPLTTWRYMR